MKRSEDQAGDCQAQLSCWLHLYWKLGWSQESRVGRQSMGIHRTKGRWIRKASLLVTVFLWTVTAAVKTTMGSDCSHEIKWCLLLGRKAMTNSLEGKLDNVWKSQDISLLRKVNIVSSVQSLNSVQLFVTHRQQNGRLPCPSQTPRACSNLCTSSWWCHPTNLSSIVRFSSCLQSFPASGSFPVSWLHQVANVLELQLQHQSFQWIFRTDFL